MEAFGLDYCELGSSIRDLSKNCCNVENNIRDLAEITENLDIFWDGDANNAFIMAINEDLIFMEALMVRLRSLIKLLNRAYKDYQQTEKVIDQIVGGIRF